MMDVEVINDNKPMFVDYSAIGTLKDINNDIDCNDAIDENDVKNVIATINNNVDTDNDDLTKNENDDVINDNIEDEKDDVNNNDIKNDVHKNIKNDVNNNDIKDDVKNTTIENELTISDDQDQNTDDVTNFNDDVKAPDNKRPSYLTAVGCTCDFDLLRSSKSSEEFQQHLLKVERFSTGNVILNGTMLELMQQLKTYRNTMVTNDLFFQFIKAIVPEDFRGDLENQTSRQFNDKLKRFNRQCKMKRIKNDGQQQYRDFLDEPYNLRIAEKAKRPPSSAGVFQTQRKRRDLIEEAERDVNVEILTYELVEAREKLVFCQNDNATLASRLKEAEVSRDRYKMDLERLKKENLELHLRMSFSPP